MTGFDADRVSLCAVPGGIGAGLRGEQFHLPLVRGRFRPAGTGFLDPGLQPLERGESDGEDRGQ
ncbi:hypothetical protein ABZV29_41105 [Streptomyces sp. NPDC005236]|uniref:hypothetical protein n=1 Tax=Streptomyces sp. NPDC005236 TaxID=3157028 RepID=UPI0033A75D9A